jgi:uncharacterized RDD family membrane protein YckC
MERGISMSIETPLPQDELAGFWDRILAALIDWNILFVAWLVALSILVISVGTVFDSPNNYDQTAVLRMFGCAIGGWILVYIPWFIYFGLMESGPWQATVGKRLLGLKVICARGDRLSRSQAFKRALCKPASLWPLLIGIFAIALSSKKTAFHDKLCSTLVVREKSRYWLRERKTVVNKSTNIQITDSQGVVLTLGEHLNNVTTQVTQNLHRSEQSSEIKGLVEVLTRQIKDVGSQVPGEVVEKMTKNLTTLSGELTSKKPDQAWYKLSLSGLKEAAEAVGSIGKPIVETVMKLWPLLIP